MTPITLRFRPSRRCGNFQPPPTPPVLKAKDESQAVASLVCYRPANPARNQLSYLPPLHYVCCANEQSKFKYFVRFGHMHAEPRGVNWTTRRNDHSGKLADTTPSPSGVIVVQLPLTLARHRRSTGRLTARNAFGVNNIIYPTCPTESNCFSEGSTARRAVPKNPPHSARSITDGSMVTARRTAGNTANRAAVSKTVIGNRSIQGSVALTR